MLTSKQRAKLKSIAATTETILQVGKGGVGDQLVKQVDNALTARELVKLHALETAPEEPGTLAQALADATRSEVVQVIGTKFVLYRESHSKPREKRIQLVKSKRPKN